MSTGAECHFTEQKLGEWHYAIQTWPYGDSENYDNHGPFTRFKFAYEHMQGNNGNPGGFSMDHHKDHKHDYRKVKGYDGEMDSICWGCDDQEPIVLPCGCTDYHKRACDEYIVNISLRVRRADLLKAVETGKGLNMEGVLEKEIEREQRSINDGW